MCHSQTHGAATAPQQPKDSRGTPGTPQQHPGRGWGPPGMGHNCPRWAGSRWVGFLGVEIPVPACDPLGCWGLFWGTKGGCHRLSSVKKLGGLMGDCFGVLRRYQGLFGSACGCPSPVAGCKEATGTGDQGHLGGAAGVCTYWGYREKGLGELRGRFGGSWGSAGKAWGVLGGLYRSSSGAKSPRARRSTESRAGS